MGGDIHPDTGIGSPECLKAQSNVTWTVIDQEDPHGLVAYQSRPPLLGSLTLVSQKSLMPLIRLSNASNWTGLLR